MKIVFDATSQTETLEFLDLEAGKVYTNVSDTMDDDLYLKTDGDVIVALRDGLRFVDGDMPSARFLEVAVELKVLK